MYSFMLQYRCDTGQLQRAISLWIQSLRYPSTSPPWWNFWFEINIQFKVFFQTLLPSCLLHLSWWSAPLFQAKIAKVAWLMGLMRVLGLLGLLGFLGSLLGLVGLMCVLGLMGLMCLLGLMGLIAPVMGGGPMVQLVMDIMDKWGYYGFGEDAKGDDWIAAVSINYVFIN